MFRRSADHPEEGPSVDQLQSLRDILDDVASLERDTDWTLAACGESGLVTGDVARKAGQLIVAYYRLQRRIESQPFDEARAVIAAQLCSEIYLRQGLLKSALQLAFPSTPTDRTESARLRLNGLGTTATRLHELRAAATG